MDEIHRRALYLDMAREVIERGAEVPLKTTGLSMGGTIRSGEWIVVRKVPPDALRRGHVVIYRQGTTFICHRVIRLPLHAGQHTVVTKGDGHFRSDPPVRADEVVARVVAVRKKHHTLRLDRGWGRVFSALLLAHALAVHALHSLLRPTPHTAPRPLRPPARRLLLWPTEFLTWIWKKLGR